MCNNDKVDNENMIPGYIRNALKLMNLPVYNGTIFCSRFFTNQNLTSI